MRVLIAGASGFLGSALKRSLVGDNHHVVSLVRRPQTDDSSTQWDPVAGIIPPLDPFAIDAVVNLAGENIAGGRWSTARRRRIRESRVRSTETLCEAFRQMSTPPKKLINASAVGFYGDRGNEKLTESSAAGTGFLAEVSQEWEGATGVAAKMGIRVALMRFGMVLGLEGGALPRMLPAFGFGLGGRLGSGKQYVSWIEVNDAVTAIRHVLENDRIDGPVNLVAPQPVTNAELTKILAQTLGRPAVLPAPAWALRLALGAMATELLLASTKAVPERLLNSDFTFAHPSLDSALQFLMSKRV